MRLNLSSFLQWKVNIFLYRKMGWKFALIYIMVLGNLYFFFNRKEKRKIQEAVKTVFANQKDQSEIRTIIKRVFRGIFWHYYEKFFNVYSPVERLKEFFKGHINPKGIGAIEQGIAGGKGVLLVTGHFGGIEYIPTYLASLNYPVTILAKFSSDRLRKISNELADRLAFKIIDANNCPNIVKAIINNLKENRIVITQCDEIDGWKPLLHNEISFLGKRINLDKTINTISRRAEASVVFGLMLRDNNRRYKFVAHSWNEILKAAENLANKPVGEVVLKLLEQYIYQYPEVWYQWKKVPEIKKADGQAAPVDELGPPAWVEPAFGRIL